MEPAKESERQYASKKNAFLQKVCVVILLFDVLVIVVAIASMPVYYQHVVNQTMPALNTGYAIVMSNERIAQEAGIRGFSLSTYALYSIVRDLIYTFVFAAVAFLIVLRARGNWFSWFTASILAFVPSGNLILYIQFTPLLYRYLEIGSLLWPAFPLFLYLFPNGKSVPLRMRWILGPLLLMHFVIQAIGLYVVLTLQTPPFVKVIENLFPFVVQIIFLLIMFSQIYRYVRISTPQERLQTKWVVAGLAAVVVSSIMIGIVVGDVFASGYDGFAGDVDLFTLLFIPLTIGISILRYRLYDIDIIIRRTLIYTLLTGLLALVYLGGAALLQQLFRSLSGQESPLAVVISTLAIAALFSPLRRRIQTTIDRRFFRQKYDTEKTLQTLSVSLSSEVDVERIEEHLIRTVSDTIQPESVSLWIKQPKKT